MLLKKVINYSLLLSFITSNFSFISCNTSGYRVITPNLGDEIYYSGEGELQSQCYFYVNNKSVSPDEWFISSYYYDENNQKKITKNFNISSYGIISWSNLIPATYNITVTAAYHDSYYSNDMQINMHNDYYLNGEILTYHDADISQWTPVIGPKWSLFDKDGNEIIDEDNPVVYDINLGWWSGIGINIDTGVISFTPSIFEGAYSYYVTAFYKNKKYASRSCYIYVYRGSDYVFEEIDSQNNSQKICSVTTNPSLPTETFDKELYIPPVHNNKKVVEIGDKFLFNCKNFNSLIFLPDTIEKIGDNYMKNCSNFNQALNLPKTIKYIGNNFMDNCKNFNNSSQDLKMPDLITKIGDNFLYDCSTFNIPILLPANLEYIGSHFLESCEAYNLAFSFPKSLKNIGSHFLTNCWAFNQEIELSSNLTQINLDYFMYNCKSFTNKIFINCDITSLIIEQNKTKNHTCSTNDPTALCYEHGMQIVGLYREVFKENFPNIQGSSADEQCYRKLI